VRLLKIVSTALFAVFAVIAGVVTAAVVAVAGVLILMVQRLLRPRTVSRLPHRNHQRGSGSKSGDVIDVTATEVSTDPSAR
jgi:hypothetical protein